MRLYAQPEDANIYGSLNPLAITLAITGQLIRDVAATPRLELLKRIGDAREDIT
jgi:hypothetical protein